MDKLKGLLKSPHVHISLATGASIIILAYFSKHVLSEPIKYLPQAIPPFLMVIWEAMYNKHKEEKKAYLKTGYWVVAIFLLTALVILFSWLKTS